MSTSASKWKTGAIVLLVLSALLGLAIAGTDSNLWTYEPTHAYGLIAFVIVDLVAIGLLMMRGGKNIYRLVALWGILQALVMLSDIATGPSSFGMTQQNFAIYLLGLGFYDSHHIAFLFPALLAVNIVLAIWAFLGSRKI